MTTANFGVKASKQVEVILFKFYLSARKGNMISGLLCKSMNLSYPSDQKPFYHQGADATVSCVSSLLLFVIVFVVGGGGAAAAAA
eukprot:4226570-Amphidinium_carterae.1